VKNPEKEIKTTLKGKTLFLKGNWSSQKIGELPAAVSGRLQVSVHSGWESDGNIEFLRTASGVSDLKLVALRKVNLEPLTALMNLESLTLQLHPNYVQRFHFGALRRLKELSIDWNEGFEGLWQSSSLEMLEVDRIRKFEAIDVSFMKCLKTLSIRNSRSVQRLELGPLRNLQKLSLISLPCLSSLQGSHFGDSVTHLSVAGLKSLDLRYYKVFQVLNTLETGMQDNLTREDLNCVPEHFLKLP
jgi:hypothetical protein